MKFNYLRFLMLVLIGTIFISCEELPDDSSQANPYEHTFTRKKQQTKRYNCLGEVVSNSLETINSLTKSFKILSATGESPYRFIATADRSSDSGGFVIGRFGAFTVDFAPSLFNLQVYEGLNEIRYQFIYCSKKDEDTNECLEPLRYSKEESFWIDVKYRVILLEGIREIKPSEQECQEQGV